MVEVWKDIPGMRIMASSEGRVKRWGHTAPMPNGGVRQYRNKPTHGHLNHTTNGKYHRLIISHQDYGTQTVHKLVCMTFHGPKPFDKTVVIHLDENPYNNRASNLRWGTNKESQNAPGLIACRKSKTGELSSVSIGKRRKKSGIV